MRDKLIEIANNNNGIIDSDNCIYKDFKIIINGVEVKRVSSIDMRKGTVTLHEVDSEGRLVINGDEFALKTIEYESIDFVGTDHAR